MSVGIISFDHKSEAQEAHQLSLKMPRGKDVVGVPSQQQQQQQQQHLFTQRTIPYILLLAFLNSAYTRLVT